MLPNYQKIMAIFKNKRGVLLALLLREYKILALNNEFTVHGDKDHRAISILIKMYSKSILK